MCRRRPVGETKMVCEAAMRNKEGRSMDAGSDSHYRGVAGLQLWWWGADGHQTSFDLTSLGPSPMREVGALLGGSMMAWARRTQ